MRIEQQFQIEYFLKNPPARPLCEPPEPNNKKLEVVPLSRKEKSLLRTQLQVSLGTTLMFATLSSLAIFGRDSDYIPLNIPQEVPPQTIQLPQKRPDIFLHDASHRNLRASITSSERQYYDGEVDYNPNCPEGFIFVSNRAPYGKSQIYEYLFATGDITQLTYLNDNAVQPRYSEDCTKIAYVQYGIGSYVFIIEGGEAYPVTDVSFKQLNPQWAPEGDLLAFEAEIDGENMIYLADTKTGVSWQAGRGRNPIWFDNHTIIVGQFDDYTNDWIDNVIILPK